MTLRMNRRAFLAASTTAALLGSGEGVVAQTQTTYAPRQPNILIFLATYQGCGPCNLWRDQHFPAWREAEGIGEPAQYGQMQVFRGRRLTFIKHEFYRPKHTTEPHQWPAEHRWILEAAIAEYNRDRAAWDRRANSETGSTNPSGTPHFWLIVDGKLVEDAIGSNGWRRVVARLKELGQV